MNKLALAIRQDVAALVEAYDRGLQENPAYAALPAESRRDAIQQTLNFATAWLETGDDHQLTGFIQSIAQERAAQGLDVHALHFSVDILEKIIDPLIVDITDAKMFWHSITRTHQIIDRQIAERFSTTERQLRQIIDRSPVGIFHTTPQGRLIDANQTFFQITGYESLAAINEVGVSSLYENPAVRQQLLGQLQHGPVTGFETRFRRSDGTIVEVSISTQLIREGTDSYLEGILEDISERRRAQASLQDSEARFRALFEKSADAYLLIADGLFVDCNPATVQMMRAHTKEEFLAVHPSVLSPDVQPDGRRSDEKADDMMRRALEHGSHRFEWLHRRMDGEVFSVEVLLTPIMMGGQQVIFTVWRDISERTRAEAQIQANLSEARLRLDISQALASAQTQEQVWEALIQHAGLYPQAHISLFSLEPRGDDFLLTLRRAAAFDSGLVDTLPVGSQLPVAHFPLLRQGAIDQPFITHDFLADERLDAASRELGRRAGIASLVTFPLNVGSEWLGVLVAACPTPAYFDPAKQQLYQTLAEQGALALQTARLREAIQTSLARRGTQVQTSTEVAQEIATAPALDELFQRVVTLIKERFGYYHAQLFRYDPAQDAVVLVSGYGEAGQQMLAAQHRLTLGRGVVGTAAATGHSILATDVLKDKDWRPNPHLPDTHGELAVPITLRQEVLGILDVQSDRAGVLTAEDQLLLEGLCGQIALAIESTRLLDETRRTQQFLDSLIDNLPIMVFGKEAAELRFVRWNKAAEELTGIPQEEMLGKNDYDLFPKAEADFFTSKDRETLASRTLVDIAEEQIQTRNKGVRLLHTRKIPLLDEQGHPQFLLGISEDITERKQAEETLRASEEHFRAVTESANYAIITADGAGIITNWNRGAELIFGYSSAAVVGQPITCLMPERYHPLHQAGMARVSAGGEQHVIGRTVELHGLRQSGEEFPLELSLATWESHAGRFYTAIITDITARKRGEIQMQETLLELERLYRATTREGWDAFLQTKTSWGYQYDQSGTHPVKDVWTREVEQAVLHHAVMPSSPEQPLSVVPLAVRGEVIGAVGVYDDPQRPLSPEELDLVQIISEQGALALESARLFEQTQHDAERERTINRIAGRIRGAQSVDQVLEIAAQELSLLTRATRSVVEISPGLDLRSQTSRESGNDDHGVDPVEVLP